LAQQPPDLDGSQHEKQQQGQRDGELDSRESMLST
jgi:hypothetical protein